MVQFSANFAKILSESGEWDLVVDYCAYKEKHLKVRKCIQYSSPKRLILMV